MKNHSWKLKKTKVRLNFGPLLSWGGNILSFDFIGFFSFWWEGGLIVYYFNPNNPKIVLTNGMWPYYSHPASEASWVAYQTFTGLWVLQKGAKVPSEQARSPTLMEIWGQISPTKLRLMTKIIYYNKRHELNFFADTFIFF